MKTEPSMVDGKNSKPTIVTMGETTYDLDDFDGQWSMLNRSFIGHTSVVFSKRMNEKKIGKVTIDGIELKREHFTPFKTDFNFSCSQLLVC